MNNKFKTTITLWISLGTFVCGLFYIFCPEIYLYKGKLMNFEEYIRFVRENMGYNYTYLQIVNLKETILKISILFVIVVSVLIIGFGKNNFKNKRNNEE